MKLQKSNEKKKEKERKAEIEKKEFKKKGEKNNDQSEKEERDSAIIRAREEKFNYIAKKGEIKRALFSHQPLIVSFRSYLTHNRKFKKKSQKN